MLYDCDCELDATNEAGETALHIMMTKNRVPCVRALLTMGADAALSPKSKEANVLGLAIQVRHHQHM